MCKQGMGAGTTAESLLWCPCKRRVQQASQSLLDDLIEASCTMTSELWQKLHKEGCIIRSLLHITACCS